MMFSVICPVYNAAKDIKKLLSLVRDLKEVKEGTAEFIFINDGSKDDSGDLISSFLKENEFKNIRLYDRRENIGLSKTRNEGIDKASGDYILFLDADDLIEPSLFKELKDKISETEKKVNASPDILVFGLFEDYLKDSSSEIKKRYVKAVPGGIFKGRDEVLNEALLLEENTLLGYAWNKAYKRKLLTENMLYFKDIKHIEDILFNIEAIKRADTITVIEKPLYHYRNVLKRKDRLTTGDIKDYFDLQKIRVNALLDLTDKIEEIAAKEYLRSFLSDIERKIDNGISKKDIIKDLKKEAKSPLFKRIKGVKINEKSLLFLYSPIQKEKFKKAYFIAGIIHFIKKYMPFLFSALKQKR